MAIAVESISSDSWKADTGTVTGISVSGSNRLLLVWVHFTPAKPYAPISVDLGGVPLTFKYRGQYARAFVDVWYLVAPATGAGQTLTVNSSGVMPTVVGVLSLSGVDQASPVGPGSGAGGFSSTISMSIGGGSFEGTVFAGVTGAKAPTLTADGAQTEHYNVRQATGPPAERVTGADSSKATAAPGPLTLSWTSDSTDDWVVHGRVIYPAAEGTPVSQTAAVNVEGLLDFSATGAIGLEALIRHGEYRILNLEAIVPVSQTRVVNVEAVQALGQTAPANIEGLLQLEPTAAVNLEALRPVTAAALTNVEALHRITQQYAFNLEALLEVTRNAQINIESLGAVVQAEQTAAINIEALLAVSRAQAANLEALLPASQTGAANLEAILAVSDTAVANLEALLPVSQTRTVNLEALPRVSNSAALLIEATKNMWQTGQASLEAIIPLSQTAIINIEAIEGAVVVGWRPFGSLAEDDTKPLVIKQIDASRYTSIQFRLAATLWTYNTENPSFASAYYSDDDGDTWTAITESQISTEETTPTLVISGPFSLSGTRLYCIQVGGPTGSSPWIGDADLVPEPVT